MSQINISPNNIRGKCDLKCAYNFDYKDNTATATNTGSSISLVQQDETPNVSYNKNEYKVVETTLVSPSSQLYNNKLADAEICIIHMAVKGGPMLGVFVPIKISNEATEATTMITDIINNVSTSANSPGQKVSIGDFNLEKIVPKKPFINYTIVEGSFSPEIIAFPIIDAIPLKVETINTLKQVIKPNTSSMIGDFPLYYNSAGPNSTSSTNSDGIYISCNPTGASTETTEVAYLKNAVDAINFSDLLNNKYVKMLIFALIIGSVFLIIFFIFNSFFNFIDGSKKIALSKPKGAKSSATPKPSAPPAPRPSAPPAPKPSAPPAPKK